MKQFSETKKNRNAIKIDWKKVSLEKLRKSLDADLENRLKNQQTNVSEINV